MTDQTAEPPPSPAHEDHPELVSANARAGLALFGVYLALYAGFMGLSAFAPGLVAWAPMGGLNLSILYGLGLIGAALALALVYMAMCRSNAERHGSGAGR